MQSFDGVMQMIWSYVQLSFSELDLDQWEIESSPCIQVLFIDDDISEFKSMKI